MTANLSSPALTDHVVNEAIIIAGMALVTFTIRYPVLADVGLPRKTESRAITLWLKQKTRTILADHPGFCCSVVTSEPVTSK
jgi:hypothetical protein